MNQRRKPGKAGYWTNRSENLGRLDRVFDEHEIFILLKAAIERDGSFVAFAERSGVSRSYISHVLSGRYPLGAAIIKGLGFRKVYVAAKKNRQ
jgi:hypothetical protein